MIFFVKKIIKVRLKILNLLLQLNKFVSHKHGIQQKDVNLINQLFFYLTYLLRNLFQKQLPVI